MSPSHLLWRREFPLGRQDPRTRSPRLEFRQESLAPKFSFIDSGILRDITLTFCSYFTSSHPWRRLAPAAPRQSRLSSCCRRWRQAVCPNSLGCWSIQSQTRMSGLKKRPSMQGICSPRPWSQWQKLGEQTPWWTSTKISTSDCWSAQVLTSGKYPSSSHWLAWQGLFARQEAFAKKRNRLKSRKNRILRTDVVDVSELCF